MNIMDYERYIRIYWEPKSLEELAQQIKDLRYTLNSAIQDLAVLKGVLEENGLMDAALYKQLRLKRMLGDHWNGGAAPWVNHSIYPHTLPEPDFLRGVLKSSPGEVKEYEEDVEGRAAMT